MYYSQNAAVHNSVNTPVNIPVFPPTKTPVNIPVYSSQDSSQFTLGKTFQVETLRSQYIPVNTRVNNSVNTPVNVPVYTPTNNPVNAIVSISGNTPGLELQS